jgi:hypothetical protein
VGAHFWEFHDLVLASQLRDDFTHPPPESRSLAALRRYARQVGADIGIFDYHFFASDKDVDEELKQARAIGLEPARLVIDGEVHPGGEPTRLIRAAIDRALARRGALAR